MVDNAANGAGDLQVSAAASLRADEEFEKMISLAASLASELLRRGYRVGLAARGEEITPEGGQAQATRLFRFLALIQPAAADVPLLDSGRTGASIRFGAGHPPEVGFGGSAAAPRRIA